MSNKEPIYFLWRQVHRPGVDELLNYLESSDFFTAPCSTKYHLSVPGGLAQHSLNVFELLRAKCNYYPGDISLETQIICALGHDLCKVDFYTTETKWRKDANGKWESYRAYAVKDAFPFGHGEKSVEVLSRYIPLGPVEKLAIRWHMGPWDLSDYGRHALNAALQLSPLVTLLFTADQEATYLLEKEGKT